MTRTPALVLVAWVALTGSLAGCAPETPPPAIAAPPPASPLGSPFGESATGVPGIGTPLVLDRTDLRLGTTVQFSRVPSRAELADLNRWQNVVHVVLSLPSWPAEYANLQELDRLPYDCDLVVFLPGYPPSRGAANAWNMIGIPSRIIVVVTEPPPSRAVVDDLNSMRGLERVIAQLDEPDRRGFERLQRPLNFRKVMP
jgi:hypothetical protein